MAFTREKNFKKSVRDRFVSWLISPFVEGICEPIPVKVDYKGNIPNTKKITIFRPKNLEEYIGQENIKETVVRYIKGTKERNKIFPHTLIYGNAGYGKTTLAQVIANELNVPFSSIIGSEVRDVGQILAKINTINGGVLFFDEVHSLEKEIAEKIYTIMEDFKFSEISISPFTLIGATTKIGDLVAKKKPFHDRFKLMLPLENYGVKDLIRIAIQYKEHEFKEEKFNEEIYYKLASNCRYTPRALIRLLEACVYFNGDIDSVLKSFNIIKNGFTKNDLKVLNYLLSNIKGVGLQALCAYLEISMENYLYEVEPYLLSNGFIQRTARGRIISKKGEEFLKEINYV